jgi:hypothetical protein
MPVLSKRATRSSCLFLCLFAACLLISALPAKAQSDDWKLEKSKKGINVYTRHHNDSKLKEVKVNMELNGTLPQLVAFVSDIDLYKQTVYRVAQAYVVKRISDREFYYYNETEMPWPVSNRDLVMHMVFQMNPATRTLTIRGTNAPGILPEKQGIVRVPLWRSQWIVKELSPNRLRIDYIFQVDPGGGLPIWLVNSLAATGPYQSFSTMEELLKRPYFQNRTFSFLDK